MDYKIVVTAEAEEDLNQFIQYLFFAKKNKQAAKNVLDDFENTIKKLKYVASSLKVCDNPRLQSLGYRRINFQQHRYFMLYSCLLYTSELCGVPGRKDGYKLERQAENHC